MNPPFHKPGPNRKQLEKVALACGPEPQRAAMSRCQRRSESAQKPRKHSSPGHANLFATSMISLLEPEFHFLAQQSAIVYPKSPALEFFLEEYPIATVLPLSRYLGPQPPGSKKQAGDSMGGTSHAPVSNRANHPIILAARRSRGRRPRIPHDPTRPFPRKSAASATGGLLSNVPFAGTFQTRPGFHPGTQAPGPEKPAFSGRTEICLRSPYAPALTAQLPLNAIVVTLERWIIAPMSASERPLCFNCTRSAASKR